MKIKITNITINEKGYIDVILNHVMDNVDEICIGGTGKDFLIWTSDESVWIDISSKILQKYAVDKMEELAKSKGFIQIYEKPYNGATYYCKLSSVDFSQTTFSSTVSDGYFRMSLDISGKRMKNYIVNTKDIINLLAKLKSIDLDIARDFRDSFIRLKNNLSGGIATTFNRALLDYQIELMVK